MKALTSTPLRMGKYDVHTTVVTGTVLSAQDTPLPGSHPDRKASLWVQMDDGGDMELAPLRGSVSVRPGQRLAIVGAANDAGVSIDDIYRVNLSTGQSSERRGFNAWKHAQALFGHRLHIWDVLVVALALATVMLAVIPDYFFLALLSTWTAGVLWTSGPAFKAVQQFENSLNDLILALTSEAQDKTRIQ